MEIGDKYYYERNLIKRDMGDGKKAFVKCYEDSWKPSGEVFVKMNPVEGEWTPVDKLDGEIDAKRLFDMYGFWTDRNKNKKIDDGEVEDLKHTWNNGQDSLHYYEPYTYDGFGDVKSDLNYYTNLTNMAVKIEATPDGNVPKFITEKEVTRWEQEYRAGRSSTW